MRILIRGGRVVDPAQNIDAKLNLLVDGCRIAALTADEPQADTVIDAEGKIVSPGFIDIHMHEDAPEDGRVTPGGYGAIYRTMLRMGVTTGVAGNCGDNEMDPGDFLDLVDEQHAPINLAMLAGHTFLRRCAGVSDKYAPATDAQIDVMASLADRALSRGCAGISFGIRYVPGVTMEELLRTSAPAKKYGRIVTAHIRSDAAEVFDAARELLDVGKALGVRIELSHIGSMAGFGQMEDFLAMVDRYREDGIAVECDCYPYDAFSTGIGTTTYDPGWLNRYGCGYDVVELCEGEYKGQRCTREIFDKVRAEHPEYETICHVMQSRDVDLAYLNPHVMVGSDGILHRGNGHPRAAGAFPRFLAEFVRSGKLSLSDGLRRITAAPAEQLGLTDRGSLRIGNRADVVVFEPDRIKDNATFEENLLPPDGIDWVLVNGVIAARGNEIICETAGSSVRFNPINC